MKYISSIQDRSISRQSCIEDRMYHRSLVLMDSHFYSDPVVFLKILTGSMMPFILLLIGSRFTNIIFFRTNFISIDVYFSELSQSSIEQQVAYELTDLFSKWCLFGNNHFLVIVIYDPILQWSKWTFERNHVTSQFAKWLHSVFRFVKYECKSDRSGYNIFYSV